MTKKTTGEKPQTINPKTQKEDSKMTEKKEVKKDETKQEKKLTKKQVVIDCLTGGIPMTADQIAQMVTDRGLGDLDTNKKTCRLWLYKIGFKVKSIKGEDGLLRYQKAVNND